jgi:hypothetical protein
MGFRCIEVSGVVVVVVLRFLYRRRKVDIGIFSILELVCKFVSSKCPFNFTCLDPRSKSHLLLRRICRLSHTVVLKLLVVALG